MKRKLYKSEVLKTFNAFRQQFQSKFTSKKYLNYINIKLLKENLTKKGKQIRNKTTFVIIYSIFLQRIIIENQKILLNRF